MRPILAIASATINEAIRRKVLLIILFITVGLLFLAPMLGDLSPRRESAVLTGFVLGVVQLSSAVLALTLTVYMIPNEIERRTIYTILSKPVQRYQFLLGKYLGAIGALGLMILLMFLVVVVVFGVQGNFASGLKLAEGHAMIFVQMSLLAAVAMCISTRVAPLVNFFLSGGIYLIGTLGFPFFEAFDKNPQSSPFAKLISKIVITVLPNFAAFNVQNKLINPTAVIADPVQYAINAIVVGVGYIVVMLVVGIWLFEKQEV